MSCRSPSLPDSDRDRRTGPEQVVVVVAVVVSVVVAVVAEERTWPMT